jgi:hypothetical protein
MPYALGLGIGDHRRSIIMDHRIGLSLQINALAGE